MYNFGYYSIFPILVNNDIENKIDDYIFFL